MPISTIFFDLGDTLVTATKEWLMGAKATLADLKSGGFQLGIISNTGTLSSRSAILGLLPADFDIAAFKSGLVLFSSEVGVAKPSPEIFQMAVTLAGVPANECLYCSENIVETLVAQHTGMRSIRLRPPPGGDLGTLRERFDEYQAAI